MCHFEMVISCNVPLTYYVLMYFKVRFKLQFNTKKNCNTELSYWLRVEMWTQEVCTKAQVQSMRERRGVDVAPFSRQILLLPINTYILMKLRWWFMESDTSRGAGGRGLQASTMSWQVVLYSHPIIHGWHLVKSRGQISRLSNLILSPPSIWEGKLWRQGWNVSCIE